MRKLIVSAIVALAVVVAAPAAAAPGARAGTFAAFTTTSITVAPGFPTATVSSDDPALSAATTATLPASTPFGAVYGTSSGRTHLSLHPVSTTVASTTTITFASPTPVGGWSFALGDVDSDTVRITGTDATGTPVTGAQLGEQGAFNSAPAGTDLPVWDPATATLTGNVMNTDGAADWFSPTVALSSLSFTVTQQSGGPVVYLWLAAVTASLAGTVTDPTGAPVPGATVTLTDPLGGSATQPSAADGSFEFAAVFPSDVTLATASPGLAPGPLVTVSPTAGAYPDLVAVVTGAALAAPAGPALAAAGTDAIALLGLTAFAVLGGLFLLVRSRRPARR